MSAFFRMYFVGLIQSRMLWGKKKKREKKLGVQPLNEQ